MDYKVLYRKYRPDDFSSIIGQDYMVSILKNSIQKDRISHAYIFSGPRGTGKTSTAKVFAKAINCLNPSVNGPCNECENCIHFKENADIIEIDAASNNGVDEIREIINNIKLAPSYSKYKVYIIDEVHMLSTSAFNALLLTLEEPPKHIVFILATTNIEAVPITILSRCQRFDFHKISTENIKNRLDYVIKEENIAIDDEAIEEIAYISDGGLRDALSILDQLSSNSSNITINEVIAHFGSISKKQISDLFESIKNNDVNKFIDMMQKLKDLAVDYKLLIKKLLERIEEEAIDSRKNNDYKGFSYQTIKEMAFELASISNYININIDPYTLIEITLLKYFKNDNNISDKKENLEEVKNTTTEDKEDTKDKNKQQTESDKIISQEIKSEVSNNNIVTKTNKINAELIKIRINNCFVNAKKEYLQEIKDKWSSFTRELEDKTLLSLLIDSNVVAASDKVAIITNFIEGTVNLINENLDEIISEYNKKYNKDYKFIAITEEKWNKEREIYIQNIRNKHQYEYLDEPTQEKEEIETKENSKKIEEVALDIFDKDKIEIE